MDLECLLLLQRHCARDWSAAELGRELRIDEQWATQELIDLTRRGFLADNSAHPSTPPSTPRYRYAAATAALDEAVQQLAVLYVQRRVTVIELIYARPPDALRGFADAFRLRKERPDG